MTSRRPPLLALVLTLSLLPLSCDLLAGSDDESRTVTTGVYVANQGNFGDGNGSVSVYDPRSSSVDPSAIANLNTIIQSIALQDERLYISANTGARIDVFDAAEQTQLQQVSGFSGPRYLALTEDTTAYVTDQAFGGPSAVHVVDLGGSSPDITTSIDVPGSPEGITLTATHAFAALGAFGDTTLVAAIDRSRRQSELIDVGCHPRYAVADRQDDVFVLCTDAAEAVVLDGASGTQKTRVSLPDTAETAFNLGQPASVSPRSHELYVATDTGVPRIDTDANDVSATLDVQNAETIGAVAYDASRRELYVARIAGFTQRGAVTVHDRSGSQTGSFEVGIAPVYLTFRREER